MPPPPSRSPVTKSSEESGRARLVTPVEQLVVPEALVATRLMTQTLIAVVLVFGIGSGGPKRQPTAEQLALLPVCAEVSGPRVIMPLTELHAATEVRVTAVSGIWNGCGTVPLPDPV